MSSVVGAPGVALRSVGMRRPGGCDQQYPADMRVEAR